MKTTKIMLTGIALMLISIFCIVADGQRGSALGGIGIVAIILGIIVFLIGLFKRD